jgi:hypothetical protein
VEPKCFECKNFEEGQAVIGVDVRKRLEVELATRLVRLVAQRGGWQRVAE